MSKPWSQPPRFLFRKYNLYHELNKLDIVSFLDVGCGAGGLCCLLTKKYGYKCEGVDYSKNAIDTANKLKKHYGLKKYPVFKKIDGDISKLKNKVDAVGCFEVLEHVKHDEKLLKDLIRMSKKYVIISVPAKQRLFDKSDVMAGHFRRYEKDQIVSMLESNNLKINKFISYGYPFTNFIKYVREIISKRKTGTKSNSMKNRSKKSGVDLLGANKYFNNIEWVVYPLYMISRIFNTLGLSEGFLIICEKSSKNG